MARSGVLRVGPIGGRIGRVLGKAGATLGRDLGLTHPASSTGRIELKRVPPSPSSPLGQTQPPGPVGGGGTTGGGGLGGKGAGGLTGDIKTLEKDLLSILRTKPSWWHGAWPLSNLANTIRDAEFAALGDLSQWPYTSSTFIGFPLIVAFTPDLNSVETVYAAAYDSSGAEVGSNGSGVAYSDSVTTGVNGTYDVNETYAVFVALGSEIFPGVAVSGTYLGQGIIITVDTSGTQATTTEQVESAAPGTA